MQTIESLTSFYIVVVFYLILSCLLENFKLNNLLFSGIVSGERPSNMQNSDLLYVVKIIYHLKIKTLSPVPCSFTFFQVYTITCCEISI